MIKTRTWIVIIVSAFALCIISALWLHLRPSPGMIANIYRDGVCIRSVDLAAVSGSEELVVKTEEGENLIRIEPGRICVAEADCPDQVCVSFGWLDSGAEPIVCLPHRLVIRLDKAPSEQNIDSVTQ